MQRGTELEKAVIEVNLRYRKEKAALILKKETPIIVTSRGAIPMQSTVDFDGLMAGGKFIAFDAKETEQLSRFPLKNIKSHQTAYLKFVESLGGIAFFLIHFKKINKLFRVPVSLIVSYSNQNEKSIPLKILEDNSKTVIIEDYLEGLHYDRQ